jgi:hypothetical protein
MHRSKNYTPSANRVMLKGNRKGAIASKQDKQSGDGL